MFPRFSSYKRSIQGVKESSGSDPVGLFQEKDGRVTFVMNDSATVARQAGTPLLTYTNGKTGFAKLIFHSKSNANLGITPYFGGAAAGLVFGGPISVSSSSESSPYGTVFLGDFGTKTGISFKSGAIISFTDTAAGGGNIGDVNLQRSGSGMLEVNNATTGTLRDLKLRNLIGTGNLATGAVSKSADYTTTTDDGTIEVDASGAARTITLFACSANAGKILVIKKIDSSANAVTIDGNASETIDGATTISLASQYSTAILQVNAAGTGWNKLAGV